MCLTSAFSGRNKRRSVLALLVAAAELERWEEELGKSPSTNATVIAGLVAAADIADFIGGPEGGAAAWYRLQADAVYRGQFGGQGR